MSAKFLIPFCIVVMLAVMLTRRKVHNVSALRAIFLAVCVSALGLLGTKLMYFIENGGWSGRSFFGAVLFFPILLFPVSVIFKVKLRELLDYATPAGMLLLGIFKFNCSIEGCCGGIVMYYSETGVPTFFPVQIVEMLFAFLIATLLFVLERKPKYGGKIYPVCLVVYGVLRFVLNFLRFDQRVFLLGMSAGSFWSLVAALIGIIWLVYTKNVVRIRRSQSKI